MSPIHLSSSKWTPIGPAPLETGGGLGAISGRVAAAAADPTDPNVIYIGGDNGGVWKRSGSAPWDPLTDHMPSLNFSGYHPLVVHPANHDLILAAVSSQGAGILKSTDAGTTWQLLANSLFDRQTIPAIAVHPTDQNTMYLSVGWQGVWKSTDGGNTWTRLSSLPGGNVTDIVLAKFNPSYLYVGIKQNTGSAAAQNGVYQSTDGGGTWTLLNGLPPGTALDSGNASIRLESGSGLGVVYVSLLTVDASGNVTAVQRFKTTDGGSTWTALGSTPGTLEKRNWHLLIAVDPASDDHIFANDAYSLYESIDSGSTWTRADTTIGWLPSINHFDWVNMSFDSKAHALCTADQGVFRYNPQNQKWTSLIDNLQVSEFYTLTLDPQNIDVAYAVGQDIFAEKFTGALHWNEMLDSIGETGRVLVDPHNDKQLCAFNPLDTNNFVRQSLTAGATWSTIFPVSLLSAAFMALYDAPNGDYNFAYASQKAFAMDPSNPARVVVGADQVFESVNIFSPSPTWAPISSTLSTDPARQFVITLAIAPSDGKTVYAATQDGHLWVTHNNGVTWGKCDTGLSGTVLGISIDPGNRSHAFAITGGDAWELSPATLTWTKITANLPSGYLGFRTIFVDWRWSIPRLFVGTDRGIFDSVNLGKSWAKFDPAFPNTSVNDLQAIVRDHPGGHHLVLAAGTYGRGGWEILIRPWGAVATAIADSGNFGDVCPGSFKDELLTINNTGPGMLSISNITSSSPDFHTPSVLSYPLLVRSGDSIDVVIRFQPSSPGAKSATLTVISNDPTGLHTIDVSGNAPTPRLTLTIANSGNFGAACVRSFKDEMLILNNSGHCGLHVFGIVSSSVDFLTPEVLSLPLLIAAGTCLPVPIRFQPSSPGSKNAAITITCDDPTGLHVIAVSGTAPSGEIAVCGSTCFGGVKACCCAERSISICNTGDCKLHVTSVRFKHKNSHWKLVSNPFPASLRPGSCLWVVIRYKATEKCARCCELIVESDDPISPVKTLELTAYTIWNDCCKQCCDECRNGCCTKTHKECCCAGHHDCCCDDGEEEDGQS
jgi:photosystem II stability/assembly factor-like uncharacterized protein